MEYLGHHSGPTMNKIDPTILNFEILLFFLRVGLIHKDQIASIVEFPDDSLRREFDRIGQGRAGPIFSQAGNTFMIDDLPVVTPIKYVVFFAAVFDSVVI